MNGYRQALRVMIAAGSVTGFFSGWVLLAHSYVPKPTATATPPAASSMTTDQALPPLDLKALAPQGDVPSVVQMPSQSGQGSQPVIQSLPALPPAPSQGFMPRLRTSGS